MDYQSKRIPYTSSQYYYHQVDTSAGGLVVPEDTIHQQSVLLSLGGYLCWWTISPRGYHPPSSQYYYHQVDTSAGGLLVQENTIHQQSVLLSLGGYLCWWTISPRGYHPPVVSITITRWIPLLVDYQFQRIPSTSSQYYYHQVDTSAGGLLVPEIPSTSSQYYYHQVDTSARGRLVPEDTIHPVVSITITRWIPLLVDDQSQRIPSTQQSILLSLGGYLYWWTISPRGYHPPVVSITITWWIPLLVDYQSQRIPSISSQYYYHQVDTSTGGLLVTEYTIHQQSVLLSLGGYLCWWTISPQRI